MISGMESKNVAVTVSAGWMLPGHYGILYCDPQFRVLYVVASLSLLCYYSQVEKTAFMRMQLLRTSLSLYVAVFVMRNGGRIDNAYTYINSPYSKFFLACSLTEKPEIFDRLICQSI